MLVKLLHFENNGFENYFAVKICPILIDEL